MAVRKPGLGEKLVTVDEFFAQSPDGEKADLIDGVVYVASPDTPATNRIVSFIENLMSLYAETRQLGAVFAQRVAFVLTPHRAPEPDVAFLGNDRLQDVHETRVVGGPDIAVEVVAQESRGRDYVEKKRLYEEAGVREYWLVDPLEGRAEFYRLEGGSYRTVLSGAAGVFRSEALPGFWLDVAWLFARPMPNRSECLQKIMAAKPSSLNGVADA